MKLEKLISVSKGKGYTDLLLKNCRIVDVFSGSIYSGNVAIYGSRIVGIGDYRSKSSIDLKGRFVVPGFVDGHIHIESSMIPPSEFARATLPHGTTTVVIDPHEISNVHGVEGIRFMIESAKYNPMSFYIMMPSLVPSTHLETSGASLSADDMAPLIMDKWIKGVAEIPPSGVLNLDKLTLAKIMVAENKRVDGHAPGLSGKQLNAFISAGIRSDHECTSPEEAKEKLKAGMFIMIREGSASKNLADLLPIITPHSSRRCFFVSDDISPTDLLEKGHLDAVLKKAVGLGLSPVTALQMVTLNPCEYFGIRDCGAISPGYRADLVVLDDLKNFKVYLTIRGGEIVAREGEVLPGKIVTKDVSIRASVNTHWLTDDDFRVAMKKGKSRIKVIKIVPGQIWTEKVVVKPRVVDGYVEPDIERDILKMMVIERHRASGNVGKGFVTGFGLKKGAIGSTIAHDSHNIILIGTNTNDLFHAMKAIRRMKGGLVVIRDGETLASLPLPIGGLMSDRPLREVCDGLKELIRKTRTLGCELDNPFMQMSFLALPVIPSLKLTDMGLVDAKRLRFTDLFV